MGCKIFILSVNSLVLENELEVAEMVPSNKYYFVQCLLKISVKAT